MTYVLALVTDAYGGQGGIAQAARDIVGAMAAQDEITLIDVLPRHVSQPAANVPRKVHQRQASPAKMAYIARAIFTALFRRPHIIFCNHLFMAPLALIAAYAVGARLIIQLHGIEVWSRPTFAQRRALESADLLLCVSRDTRTRLCSYIDMVPERAIVLNNTVDSKFAPGDRLAARMKFGLKDEFVILTVGRLNARERYKGQDQIIAALPNLKHPNGRPILYVIAGDGDDRAQLECAARVAGVRDRVRFLGQVHADDLPDLYRAADLFVLPSKGEGFGIVFLEAMACGTPALGLAIGGASDALGEGEWGEAVVEAELVGALVRCLDGQRIPSGVLSTTIRAHFGYEVFRQRAAALFQPLIRNTQTRL